MTEKQQTRHKIGRNVAAERTRRDWTQQRLAEKSGVSESYVAKIESGAHMPSVYILGKIAGALDLRVDDLMPESPANREVS